MTEVAAGDFIITTGAIREVRRIYPAARITLVVYSRTFELAKYCPYADDILVIPQRHSIYNLPDAYRVNMELAQILLEQKFDICFTFGIHAQLPLLMYMSGANIRVTAIDHENMMSFDSTKGLKELLMRLATHLFPYNEYGYHRADRAFSLLENLLHLPILNRKLEVWCTSDDVELAKTCLIGASNTVYSLGMGGRQKNSYPPEKYAHLVEMILREEPTATFVILGGGQKDLASTEIFKNALPKTYAKNIIDLTDKLNYRQSGAVLSFCQMHMGNDTGTIHLAAAADCPVLEPICFSADLSMFTTDCPLRWYPYGVPSVVVQPKRALPECNRQHFYRGCGADFPHCITQIEPETLFKSFQLLKERIAAKIIEPLYIH